LTPDRTPLSTCASDIGPLDRGAALAAGARVHATAVVAIIATQLLIHSYTIPTDILG
jgi:hypothetical protein